jgi:hypothetical protein
MKKKYGEKIKKEKKERKTKHKKITIKKTCEKSYSAFFFFFYWNIFLHLYLRVN